jgi:hypothetical protein
LGNSKERTLHASTNLEDAQQQHQQQNSVANNSNSNSSNINNITTSPQTSSGPNGKPLTPVPEGGNGSNAKSGRPIRTPATADGRPGDAGPPKARNVEYLVVYVHFLTRLIKRLQSKGIKKILATVYLQKKKNLEF